MAIEYVGGMSGGRAGSNSTSSVNFALTGGLGEATPKAGDLVIITVAIGTQARTPACAVSGYTSLTQLNATAQTQDTSMNVSYKAMGGTPDTSFTLPSTGNIADAQSYCVQVFRGVDNSNPLNVTPTSATGTGTTRADPASITPTTAGSWVVICAGGGAAAASNLGFADLTNVITHPDADTNDSVAAMGTKTNWTSGAFNCSAANAGDATSTSSWCAYSLVLQPSALAETITETFDSPPPPARWGVFESSANVDCGYDTSLAYVDINENVIGAQGNHNTGGDAPVNLIGSSVFWYVKEISKEATPGGQEANFFWIEDFNSPGDQIGFSIYSDGSVVASARDAYTETSGTSITTTWNADKNTYRWFRIRVDSTNVYWDTAPSTATNPPSSGDWTNRKTLARSSTAATWSKVVFLAGVYHQDSALGQPVTRLEFDGFNAAATLSNPTHAATGALVGSGVTLSGSSQHKAKHDTTGVLTGVTVLAGAASSKTTRSSSGVLTGSGAAIVGAASSKTTRSSSGALVGTGRILSGVASSKTTRSSSGALTGSGPVVAGISQHKRKHATTGALVGPGSTVTGAASRKVTHTSIGALGGPGAALAGVAAHLAKHSILGALAGPGSLVAGTAKRFRVHSSTAVLVAAGVLLSGASRRFRSHASSGALVGTGAVVAGTAQHKRKHTTAGALAGVPVLSGTVFHGGGTHSTSGALVGTGKILSGTATHIAHHTTTGALVGTGKTLTGSAARTRVHSTAGALVATGRVIAGTARRSRTHATTGTLAGVGKVLVGSASKSHLHTVSGVVHGPGPHLVGISIHGGPYHQAIGTLVGPGVILEGVAGRLTYGQLGLRPASENGDRPIREQGPRPSEIQSTDRPSMIQESIRPPKVQTTTRKNL